MIEGRGGKKPAERGQGKSLIFSFVGGEGEKKTERRSLERVFVIATQRCLDLCFLFHGYLTCFS